MVLEETADGSHVENVTGPTSRAARSTEKAIRQILSGARLSIAKLGAAKSTIVDIGRFAECSRPHIYKYFSGRSEIIDRICVDELKFIDDKLPEIRLSDGLLHELFTEFIFEFVCAARDNVYIMSILEDYPSWRRLNSRTGGMYQFLCQRCGSLLNDLRAAGSLVEDLDLVGAADWISSVTAMLIGRFADEQIGSSDMRDAIQRFVVPPLLQLG